MTCKGRWFSPDPPVSFTTKTDLHDITEMLLKLALNTIKHTNKQTRSIYLQCELIIYNDQSFRPFLLCQLIRNILTRFTRWVSGLKQEVFTLKDHLSSPPVFIEVCVAQCLVFCVVFSGSLFICLSIVHNSDIICNSNHDLFVQDDFRP